MSDPMEPMILQHYLMSCINYTNEVQTHDSGVLELLEEMWKDDEGKISALRLVRSLAFPKWR
jgi:hypothetical protein